MPLTDTAVRNAKPLDKPQRLFDGNGMYLEVKPSGSKYWRLKYRFGGKEKLLALGVYPDVSLRRARELRDAARSKLADGIDPSLARRAEKLTRMQSAENSFEAIAREWHAKFSKELSPSHAARNLRRLEVHVFPDIGSRPVAGVEPPIVLHVLQRIEATGHIETAHRVRSIIGQVMRYAVATGRATRDPTPDLRGAIPPSPVNHHAAITDPEQLGKLVRLVRGYQGTPVVMAALQLAPFVFQRPGELRLATWPEIDLDAALWTVPAARMKRRKAGKKYGADHLVPLSRQAIEILRELHKLTGRGTHVFPSVRGDVRPMSDGTLNAAFKLLGIDAETAVPHGWRATARTLAVEQLKFPAEIVELQLAHTVKNPLGRAYDRTQWLDERKQLMQVWADYLDALAALKGK